MKLRLALILAFAVLVLGLPVYAQHGHGGGGGGAAGGLGHGMSQPANSNSNSHANSGKGSKESSVSDRLEDNKKLASKLQSLLPAGTDLQQAAQGYKNLGQFVAAVHVSHNLGIPFDQLKAKMFGPPSESLGKAIQALNPTANAKEEASKAEKQAKQDMDDSTSS